VLFVVMMLDVKAIENPWSAKEKRLLLILSLIFFICLINFSLDKNLQEFVSFFVTTYIGSLVFFSAMSYEEYFKNAFYYIIEERFSDNEMFETWFYTYGFEDLAEYFRLFFYKESIDCKYDSNNMWFVEFDTTCALNDPSYLLYSTYAILLIIAGVILLRAMVGAITLTLEKNCPESLYRQLGRESKNAVFSIKEKTSSQTLINSTLDVSS